MTKNIDKKQRISDLNFMSKRDIEAQFPELKITDVTGRREGQTDLSISTGQLPISSLKPKFKEPTMEEDPKYWRDLFQALM